MQHPPSQSQDPIVHGDVAELIAILAALRTPGSGCPWDLRQTHASLAPFAIEEAYELADAIARGDAGELRDELGDCLLQVVFHARLAEEAGRFGFADIVAAACTKMRRRHPHIFPTAGIAAPIAPPEPLGANRPHAGPEQIMGASMAWEAIKAEERARTGRARGLLADIPTTLPGLTRAVKLQGRAASVGFDWNDLRLVLAKVREEVDEVEAEVGGGGDALRDEIGDLLFAVGNLARHAGVDPEAALRSANAKFERRFAAIERGLAEAGTTLRDATLAEMEALWLAAKHEEKSTAAGQAGTIEDAV